MRSITSSPGRSSTTWRTPPPCSGCSTNSSGKRPEQFGGFPGFQIAPPCRSFRRTATATPVSRRGALGRPLDQAEKALQPFRDVAPIVADGAGPLPYPALNGAFDALYPKGLRATGRAPSSTTSGRRDRGARRARIPGSRGHLHDAPLSGQRRLSPRRSERHRLRLPRRHVRDGLPGGLDRPGQGRERIKWLRDYYEAPTPYSEPGGYVNFMQDDDPAKFETTTGRTTTAWSRSSGPTTPAISSTSTRTWHRKRGPPAGGARSAPVNRRRRQAAAVSSARWNRSRARFQPPQYSPRRSRCCRRGAERSGGRRSRLGRRA